MLIYTEKLEEKLKSDKEQLSSYGKLILELVIVNSWL